MDDGGGLCDGRPAGPPGRASEHVRRGLPTRSRETTACPSMASSSALLQCRPWQPPRSDSLPVVCGGGRGLGDCDSWMPRWRRWAREMRKKQIPRARRGGREKKGGWLAGPPGCSRDQPCRWERTWMDITGRVRVGLGRLFMTLLVVCIFCCAFAVSCCEILCISYSAPLIRHLTSSLAYTCGLPVALRIASSPSLVDVQFRPPETTPCVDPPLTQSTEYQYHLHLILTHPPPASTWLILPEDPAIIHPGLRHLTT